MPALSNIKVITLGINLPVPLAASKLARLGADITKIEPPDGDPLKSFAKDFYHSMADGQKVISLNLKDPADQTQLGKLLDTAHILLTSQRPKALKNLGLDWSSLSHKFKQLSMIIILIGFCIIS